MVQRHFLTLLSLILASSLLSGCSLLSREPEKEIVTVTEVIKPKIAVAERPKPLQMNDVQFYVVTEKNFEDFRERFLQENADFVFYAISVRDYENLSLNMAEIKRYILQQKEIIIYYEKSVTEEDINNSNDNVDNANDGTVSRTQN
jgi:hypothetical protein